MYFKLNFKANFELMESSRVLENIRKLFQLSNNSMSQRYKKYEEHYKTSRTV